MRARDAFTRAAASGPLSGSVARLSARSSFDRFLLVAMRGGGLRPPLAGEVE
jgi:hypothetical protein